MGTDIYKADTYSILKSPQNMVHLDDIILPLQSMKRNAVNYELIDYEQAESKVEDVISNHKR